MKYFGTDGIRGKIDTIWFEKIISKVAKAVVEYYHKNKLKKQILIGNDSRISADYILSKLATILLKNGIEIHNLSMCSSPCLAYTTKQFNFPLGLMISASHNPYEFNGIKFFLPTGEKANEEFEKEFELLMDKKIRLKNNEFKTIKNVECLQENYVNMLKNLKKFDFLCIFDCSNGGISEICKKIFKNHEIISAKPNGKNINENCGSTHVEKLKSLCIKKQKIGFAFDGDGDRICVVDKNGAILSGDEILFLLSKFYLKNFDYFIGTIYTNSALENELKKRQIITIKSDVGEKFINKNLKRFNSPLAGEDSGHIIVSNFTKTSDGILTAILIGNMLESTHSTCSELIKNYCGFFQKRADIILPNNHNISNNLNRVVEYLNSSISVNKKVVDFKHNNPFDDWDVYEKIKPQMLQLIDLINKEKHTRVVVRKSGTEPVVRLFVESKNENIAKIILQKTYSFFQSVLNLIST